jgi:hypothetical protein
MTSGIKHLITCRCVLPQFKRREDPPQHQFVVFSVIDDDNNVRPKFAQCNNCGIIHKVTEINRSEIMASREDMRSIAKITDIRLGLPQGLAALLEQNDVDLPTWEMAEFIYSRQDWGQFVVLSTDEAEGTRQGKYVSILGANLFKVETFSREEKFEGGK